MDKSNIINIALLYKSNYYVYEHIIDGNVFYVGKGSSIRAVDFRKRGIEWESIVNGRISELEVNIVSMFDSDQEAIFHEAKHIKELRKIGIKLINITHNNDNEIFIWEETPKEEFENLIIDKKWLDNYITAKEKRMLCEDLYILDGKGRLRMWPTIREYIENSGYIVEDTFDMINGKKTRVSIITLKD